MTDNNNDVSMDPLYQDTFELSGVHAGWRNQYTDQQRYASMRKGNHQSYQQICTELHYTSGGIRERRGTGGRGG